MDLSDLTRVKLVLFNAFVRGRNLVAEVPGDKPRFVVLTLSGGFSARHSKRDWFSFPPELGAKQPSLEAFAKLVSQLCEAEFLAGVVLRFEALQLDLSTTFALREQLLRLQRAGKDVTVYATQFSVGTYYLASAANRIIMPESAELGVYGFALETVFMKDALARFGIEFEKLAIKEYKNAGDNFARSSMSDAQREHYDALLQSFETTLLTAIATQRATVTGQPIRPEDVKTWIDTGVSSAEQAKRLGMIDDVLYEDEFLTDAHKPVNAAQRFLKRHPYDSAERVAVISLLGTIVTGKSRRSGLPIPIISTQAGSETLMAAFRQAEEDESTRAIVFYVDSGGGSALASDLIWREVQRIKRKKPVVAVMGQYAASGGYYVLTHAQHIIAAPTTLTGSIGVLVGKFVQEQFNQKYGFQADVVQRGELARIYSSHKAFSEHERDKVTQFISEVYDRFTARVADGRNLSQTRVNELGRGRVYSGADAYELGLVDELGDIELGIMRARELAGLPEHSPVWNVPAPNKYVLPEASDPTTLLRSLQGLLQERALLLHDALITVRH